jgi:HlyD family secretion protein
LTNSRRRILYAAGALVLGAGVVFFVLRGRETAVRYQTAAVDRGDIEDVVGATGVLQAVRTVDVGSQVSGTIQVLNADFNSRVTKDQVIARLDPSILQARVEQMQANLTSAVAGVTRAQATLDDAKQKYERAKTLAGEQLLAESDLETARSNFQVAAGSVQGAQAAVSVARANLRQAQVDLTHTIIRAPIDGVVIARNVDVGQTVAASLQAPVLFQIANDLSQLQVNASIDEADVGRVESGQSVDFRVDAFPDRTFTGRVEQVRLQPITASNVVTYNTIISVANESGRLMPGMTATVTIVHDRRENVLRLPAAALRYRPEGFVPAARTRVARGGEAEGATPAGAVQPAAETTGAGARTRGAGRRRGGTEGGEGRGEGRPSRGLVFVLDATGKPSPTPVRTGLSDGRYVELVEGPPEGTQVVTGVLDPKASPAPARGGASPATTNPFNPGRPQRRAR